ncbi:Integrator complex subunit 7 [Apophysomyces ossiformis]|uniref:Integrator complex subunit 7 n=1 Tax=Apophysomyces ossiformis TaxID=679940 RepID=A0A8H7EU56_9FUNG|nr:Integrator complex subunit 7 [Apophysomyces ossiformis]
MAEVKNEQQDGHKILVELEAKFNAKPRCAVQGNGTQIHVLATFADFLEQYPFPVVINAGILKLADWFRKSNNVIKCHVYKVFKQASELHLAKVINIEETVRRIMPVLESNDPCARAITLRVLGYDPINPFCLWSCSILERLELATEREELEAAIWAGDQICSRSARFPSVIFSKIVTKLKDTDTTIDIKLRLVKIFRHMHRDIAMAREAKETCLELLKQEHNCEPLVIVVLRTLTLLLSEALIDRNQQIDLLLSYIMNDRRERVQYSAFQDLILLGKNDLMFDRLHMTSLLHAVTTMSASTRLEQRALKCAHVLIWSHPRLITHLLYDRTSSDGEAFISSLKVCEEKLVRSIHSQGYTLVVACAQLLCSVVRIALIRKETADEMDVDQTLASDVFSLGNRVIDYIRLAEDNLYITVPPRRQDIWTLRELLKVKSRICRLMSDEVRGDMFLEGYKLLATVNNELLDDYTSILVSYLSSIYSQSLSSVDRFFDLLTNALQSRRERPKFFVNIVRLFLQTAKLSLTEREEVSDRLMLLLKEYGGWNEPRQLFTVNAWELYCLGKVAARYGWLKLLLQPAG